MSKRPGHTAVEVWKYTKDDAKYLNKERIGGLNQDLFGTSVVGVKGDHQGWIKQTERTPWIS